MSGSKGLGREAGLKTSVIFSGIMIHSSTNIHSIRWASRERVAVQAAWSSCSAPLAVVRAEVQQRFDGAVRSCARAQHANLRPRAGQRCEIDEQTSGGGFHDEMCRCGERLQTITVTWHQRRAARDASVCVRLSNQSKHTHQTHTASKTQFLNASF